ncbi:hypothetical protein LCGC14_2962250, partial [marine sediment metagenome]
METGENLADIDPFLNAYLDAPETQLRDAITSQRAALDASASLSTTFRHSGWQHNRSLVLDALVRTKQSTNRRDEFCQCGSHAYVLRNVDNPTEHRIAGSACHDRFCLPCGQERSQAIALNVLEAISDKQVRFLTLTVRSQDEPLTDLLDHLYVSFRKLRATAFWKRRVSGGVALLEIKRNVSDNRWHPHFHCLVEGSFLPQQDLKRIWHRITGDSWIVDIRLVRAAREAAQYVTKYACKPLHKSFLHQPASLDEAVVALKGRKLCVTFGSWRGVTLARTIAEGAWENVGTLEGWIADAAHGDEHAATILASLTDSNLPELYARAPPKPE